MLLRRCLFAAALVAGCGHAEAPQAPARVARVVAPLGDRHPSLTSNHLRSLTGALYLR